MVSVNGGVICLLLLAALMQKFGSSCTALTVLLAQYYSIQYYLHSTVQFHCDILVVL